MGSWKSDQFYFSEAVGNELHCWKDSTLWEASRDCVPTFIPISRFPLRFDIWDDTPSHEELRKHLDRILDADLQYAIILNIHGHIMDGYHRLAKAILMNCETVKVVWLHPLPPPDFKYPI